MDIAITEEDLAHLNDLYGLIKENEDLEEECTIGWENDKMIVRTRVLRRMMKNYFVLCDSIRKMGPYLPKPYLQ